MNRFLLILCVVCITALLAILIRECNSTPLPVHTDSTAFYKKEAAILRKQISTYKPQHYHDTIERIRTKYRDRLAEVPKLIFDSTWQNVCRMFADSQTGESCQRVLVGRLLSGDYDAELIGVYQIQRSEDSNQIELLMDLDTLNQKAITAHESNERALKGEIVQAKRKSGRKTIVAFFAGVFGGFIIGKI